MEIREFDRPKLEKGAAIGRMLYSGVCGTDKHSYLGESVQYKGTKNEFDIPYPIIPGHENVLVIDEIDEEGAKNLEFEGAILKPGDRVTMCPDVICGKCYFCKNFPSYPWCETLDPEYGCRPSCDVGKHLYAGFAEYIYLVPGTRLYKVPENLPDHVAALTELMCVTYSLDKAKEFNSFSLEGFNFGDTVVVQGVGPLGLMHVIKARMMGAGKIIVTDISDYKLNLAKNFGADVALNVNSTTQEERVELVMQHTRGLGADLAIECVGKPHDVVPEGLAMLRKAGMYIETGAFVECGKTPIDIHEICAKNLRIVGMANHSHNSYRQCMEMMLRSLDQFPWQKFISHVFPLAQADDALKASMSEESMKVLIQPNQGFEHTNFKF
jgi:L-iditol 2-dehydrogenase